MTIKIILCTSVHFEGNSQTLWPNYNFEDNSQQTILVLLKHKFGQDY